MALIGDDGSVRIWRTPSLSVRGRRRPNIPAMIAIIKEARSGGDAEAALEAVHAFPKQGVASMFSFGHNMGVWEGILSALQVPYTLVPPSLWKKAMLVGVGRDKNASMERAAQLFPAVPLRDHNEADALLLAAWLLRSR